MKPDTDKYSSQNQKIERQNETRYRHIQQSKSKDRDKMKPDTDKYSSQNQDRETK